MSRTTRQTIGDRMLFAVNALVEEKPEPEQNTKEFWDAFAQFVPEYISGKFSMVVNEDTGSMTILYKTK